MLQGHFSCESCATFHKRRKQNMTHWVHCRGEFRVRLSFVEAFHVGGVFVAVFQQISSAPDLVQINSTNLKRRRTARKKEPEPNLMVKEKNRLCWSKKYFRNRGKTSPMKRPLLTPWSLLWHNVDMFRDAVYHKSVQPSARPSTWHSAPWHGTGCKHCWAFEACLSLHCFSCLPQEGHCSSSPSTPTRV